MFLGGGLMAVGDVVRRIPTRALMRGGRLVYDRHDADGNKLSDHSCEGWLVHTVSEEPEGFPPVLEISWEPKPC